MRLVVEGVACRRGERTLFTDLGFSLGAGDALVLTGPNGSGKSSLLRILAGLLRPSAGRVALEGWPETRAPGEAIHYLGHRDAAKPQIEAGASLRFWQAVLGGTADCDAILAGLGLGHARDLPAGYLSAGQTRRLALARLAASPRPVWLMDEPTASLDAAGDELLEDMIARHRAQGGIAVIATHKPLGIDGAARLGLGPS